MKIKDIFHNKVFYIFLFVCISILFTSTVIAFNGKIKKTGFKKYVEGEVLVIFKANISIEKCKSTIQAFGDVEIKQFHKKRLMQIRLKSGLNVEDAIAEYKKNPYVEYAQPNYIYRINAYPNDPDYDELWGLNNTGQPVSNEAYSTHNPGTPGSDMDMELTWDQITDCSSVIVAVIDTGVNYDHEDLADNMWDDGSGNTGYDFIDDDETPMDLNGHGTHVASIIGAVGNNSRGITGVCWQADIMAVRVLDAAGAGTTATTIAGLDYAVEKEAKVVNFSLGGSEDDTAFSEAIMDARNVGVLIVAAAGNAGSDNDQYPSYPASYTQNNIISVAALDQAYDLADFSNYGSTSVDVGAPGTNILSSYAGIVDSITDDFNDGGSLDWLEAINFDWSYRMLPDLFGTDDYDFLVLPNTWPDGGYWINLDAQVYKTFSNLSLEIDSFTLNFIANIDIELGYDFFEVYYSDNASNPISPSNFLHGGSGNTGGYMAFSFALDKCIDSEECSIGFRLTTNDNDIGFYNGIGIIGRNRDTDDYYFSIDTLTLNENTYAVFNGTSMAAPHVTGLAAMLLAYNPDYTYQDAINAIKNSGEDAASLYGITSTGKSVNAWNALCYINTPTGLTVQISE